MSLKAVATLWEQSKVDHQNDADALANKYRMSFEKRWSLLLIPFFYIKLISFIIPSLRRKFIAERNNVRAQIVKIVAEFAPQIRDGLSLMEEGFNQWEAENAGPSLCGSGSASEKESRGRKQAKEQSVKLLEKIAAIPQYEWHFHPLENPYKMVSNPYPGYLTTERGQNYCNKLIQVFC